MHIQTLNLADIYRRFIYEDNLISRRYPESKKSMFRIFKKIMMMRLMREQVLIALANDKLAIGKNHARNGEWIDITMTKVNILLSMDEDVDWQNYLKYIDIDLKFVEEQRHNPDSKLPNFNTGRLLVPESQAVNESLGLTEAPTDLESSKEL
ncbi:hypothetical protein Tco_1264874 [Tanacetum coccineum]